MVDLDPAKNLVIKDTKTGRVVFFREGLGHKIEEYLWLKGEGYAVETTNRHYIQRWGKYYEDTPEEEVN